MARRKKKTNYLLSQNFILGYLAISALLYFFLKKKKDTTDDDGNIPPSNESLCPVDTFGNPPSFTSLDNFKVLKKEIPAKFSYETAFLQRLLNNKRNACLKVDGYFDDKTELAVKALTGSYSTSTTTVGRSTAVSSTPSKRRSCVFSADSKAAFAETCAKAIL